MWAIVLCDRISLMDKVYKHKDVEEKIYREWEKSGYFKPEINPKGKPYCIILPPPNANGALHFGHAMFTVEDILIRYHRMKGESCLWLPGTDHAGIETQFVFEKKLKQEGKSRLDFDQETLYKMIWDYVEEHRGGIQNQLRRLGFSLDWSREKYTLDSDIIKLVYKTFKKMHDEGLVYRDYRLVNYCTFDGTSFSDLEVVYRERKAPLYYLKYGPFTIATVRPETKFRDTALAVNPNDPRYSDKIGKEYEIQGLLGKVIMKIIADPSINPEFGTGIMKVTPAHDPHDFELGKKYNLPVTPIISFDGKMDFSWFLRKKDIDLKYRARAEKYHGKYVKEARKLMVEDLIEDKILIKTDKNYAHRIGACYKCKNVLEPLPLEQWFVKVERLRQEAIEAVKKGRIKIYPKNFENIYFQWLENLRDWNISRQIVWGIRIPAWQCSRCHPELGSGSNTRSAEMLNQVQHDRGEDWIVTDGEKLEKCPNCGSKDLEQDPDTFDTWFSSSQWPFVTLKTTRPGDFEKFYPTSVMETGYDILKAWVSRMVMMGIYATGKVPFRDVLVHGLVNDPYGKKMSKSKGNVANPLELVDAYGADSVRFALIYGNATGNDQSLSYPKLEAARKFTNKLWNMARFIYINRTQNSKLKTQNFHPLPFPLPERSGRAKRRSSPARQAWKRAGVRGNNLTIKQLSNFAQHKNDKQMIKKTQELVREVTGYLDEYNFNYAAEKLYDFAWHEFADKYIENVKSQMSNVKSSKDNSFIILNSLFLILLKLLHPFMPFVTEEIYQRFKLGESIMIDRWPVS